MGRRECRAGIALRTRVGQQGTARLGGKSGLIRMPTSGMQDRSAIDFTSLDDSIVLYRAADPNECYTGIGACYAQKRQDANPESVEFFHRRQGNGDSVEADHDPAFAGLNEQCRRVIGTPGAVVRLVPGAVQGSRVHSLQVRGIVDHLRHGLAAQRAALELEYAQSAIRFHTQQVERSACRSGLSPNEFQTLRQHIRIPHQNVLQRSFGLRLCGSPQGCDLRVTVVVNRPYLEFFHCCPAVAGPGWLDPPDWQRPADPLPHPSSSEPR